MNWRLRYIEEDETPVSAGFWYDAGSGELDKFIECLENEETKTVCYAAWNLLNKLERVIDKADIVEWM